jgi:hypothetical protein
VPRAGAAGMVREGRVTRPHEGSSGTDELSAASIPQSAGQSVLRARGSGPPAVLRRRRREEPRGLYSDRSAAGLCVGIAYLLNDRANATTSLTFCTGVISKSCVIAIEFK